MPNTFPCPYCGYSTPEGSKFCQGCGKNLAQAPVQTVIPASAGTAAAAAPAPIVIGCACGFPNPPDSKFCQGCGKRLEAAEPVPVSSVAPSQPAAVAPESQAIPAAAPVPIASGCACGFQNPPDSKFCQGCGKKLGDAAASVSTAAPAPVATAVAVAPAEASNPAQAGSTVASTPAEAPIPVPTSSTAAPEPSATPAPVATSVPAPMSAAVPAPTAGSAASAAATAPALATAASAPAPVAEAAVAAAPAPASQGVAPAPASASVSQEVSSAPASTPQPVANTAEPAPAVPAKAEVPDTAPSAAQLCPSCSASLIPGAKFCQKCGTTVTAGTSTSAAPPQPADMPFPAATSGNVDQIFVPQQRSSKGPAVLVVLLLLVLGGLGWAAWNFFSGSADVTVTASEQRIRVAPGETVALQASVSGSKDTDVVWSLDEGKSAGQLIPAGVSMVGGTFQATANYTAPQTSGTYHIIAASHANSRRKVSIEAVVGEAGVGASLRNTVSAQIVGTWQWPKPQDDLTMQIDTDGSIGLTSSSQPGNVTRGTYKFTDDSHVEINLNGDIRKWQILSSDVNSFRVMSESREGVSAMTFTRVSR
jgi:hypothetical protein